MLDKGVSWKGSANPRMVTFLRSHSGSSVVGLPRLIAGFSDPPSQSGEGSPHSKEAAPQYRVESGMVEGLLGVSFVL